MPVHPNRGAIGRAAVIAGVVVLLLGACVPTEPIAVVTPSATPAPVFATDAEALAAAEKAYAAYLGMSDLIAKEGGRDPERIAPFVTEEQLVEELEGFASLLGSGVQLAGETDLVSFQLQSADLDRNSSSLSAYVCLDYSAAEFRRPDGSAVNTARPFSTVLVLTHFSLETADGIPRVALVEPWTQDSECQ